MARAPAATADGEPRTRARDSVKRDLKNLKEDVGAVGREEADRLRDLAAQADEKVRARAAELRQRAQRYYDEASERFDEYQRYLTERVQERPLQSTGIALGVGVILGLLLAGGRR